MYNFKINVKNNNVLLIFTLRLKESLEVIPFQSIKLLCDHVNELVTKSISYISMLFKDFPFDMSNYKLCI